MFLFVNFVFFCFFVYRCLVFFFFFFFSSRRRHTRWNCDWSSDVCSSDLPPQMRDISAARADFVRLTAAKYDIDPAYIESVLAKAQTRDGIIAAMSRPRSEERRVGKECRSRWST